jgi:murein DD-endopeptidase MepM/ murein hydrolase activator NlpD
MGQLAGPPADGTTDCPAAGAKSAHAKKTTAAVATLSAGSATILHRRKKAVVECKTKPRASKDTASPDRRDAPQDEPAPTVLRNDNGVPTVTNPTTSLALPGAVPVGVPNFFIDKFRIPPFLLPIYQAAGIQYGVRWEVLAAINEIETDYGRNLNISSAGALGWMQFMPSTWKSYGTDANRDGRKDPFNPVDAIFAAARYLRAAGADQDLRKAIFAYNHADWYVDSVLMRARLIGGLPDDLIGSLSGLTQGHFPVFAKSRYADDLAEHGASRRVAMAANAALPVESQTTRRSIDIFAKAGSPAIAVQDGRIVSIGTSKRLGNFVRLQDAYGNTYTYAQLKKLSTHVPVPKRKTQSKASIAKELALPGRDPKPKQPASAGKQTSTSGAPASASAASTQTRVVPGSAVTKERLFAHPARPNSLDNGGSTQILESESSLAEGQTLKSYFTSLYGLDAKDVVLKRLVRGRRVIAGTILGRIGRTSKNAAPHLSFGIRPAGRGAPKIDPKPILDGWKLLESTEIYRARGKNALLGGHASIGEIMLMTKEALAQRVLSNPRIEVYSCGRRDIEAGLIDRRVLATLEFLAGSGLEPTVTSLHCGHGYYTASGNVSEHSSGSAVDIAKINGIPILGHQGEGTITDMTIRRLLTLQGSSRPHQIISLMTYKGADNTMALGDHADHIHVGFRPQFQAGTPDAKQVESVLKPSQWIMLIDRLGRIDNPTVSVKPSKYAISVPVRRASAQHLGE